MMKLLSFGTLLLYIAEIVRGDSNVSAAVNDAMLAIAEETLNITEMTAAVETKDTTMPPVAMETMDPHIPTVTNETMNGTRSSVVKETLNNTTTTTNTTGLTPGTVSNDINEKGSNTVTQPRPIVSFAMFQDIMHYSRDYASNSLSVFAIISNILMIVILATIGNRIEHSVKVYYIYLAICDLCVILGRVVMNAFSHHWSFVDAEFGSYWYAGLYRYIGSFWQRWLGACGLYVTAIICLQRLLVICIPLHINQSVLTKRPGTVVALITVLLSGVQAINLFRFDREAVYDSRLNITTYRESTAKFDKNRKEAMEIWDTTEFIIRKAFPMLLILGLVIVLAFKIKTVERKRKLLSSTSPKSIEEQGKRLTQTSLAVGIITFLCHAPVETIYVVYKVEPEIFLPTNRTLYVSLMFSLAPLAIFSYGCNFIIFILTSPTFRAHIRTKLMCCKCLATESHKGHGDGQRNGNAGGKPHEGIPKQGGNGYVGFPGTSTDDKSTSREEMGSSKV